MIKYENFLENMGKIAMEKNYNPLQVVLKRLKYFLGHNKQTPSSLLERIIYKKKQTESKVG